MLCQLVCGEGQSWHSMREAKHEAWSDIYIRTPKITCLGQGKEQGKVPELRMAPKQYYLSLRLKLFAKSYEVPVLFLACFSWLG